MSWIEKLPVYDSMGRLIVLSAPEVRWDAMRLLWEQETQKIVHVFHPENYQIAVLGHAGDATSDLSYLLASDSATGIPVMRTRIHPYPDGETDLFTIGEGLSRSVYIVASVTSPEDFENMCKLADYFRNTLGALSVTGVLTFMSGTRSDKNVRLLKAHELDRFPEKFQHNGDWYVFDPRASTLHTRMGEMAQFFNRVMITEPHSGATAAYGFEYWMPVLAHSPWLWMIQQEIQEEHDLNGYAIVRPDEGRNIASERLYLWLLSQGYDVVAAACEKRRLGNDVVDLELRENDKDKVRGRRCLAFDDEIASGSTYKAIIKALQQAGAVDLTALYIHPKFVWNWFENLGDPFLQRVVGTNSRLAIGDVAHLGERHQKRSLAPYILDLIMADARGVNFWTDPIYCNSILQTQPEERASVTIGT